MGKKTLLGLAGFVLAGAAASGCQSTKPQGGPMMSGVPMMSSAGNQQNQQNLAANGLPQNQNSQFQNWNNRNAQTGMQPGATVPAGGTGYPAYNNATQPYSTSRPAAGSYVPDRSYQSPSVPGSPQSFNRSATTPAIGSTASYPRTTTTGSDRMLTSPTAPSYQPTSYGSTTNGSSIQSGMTKPSNTITSPPAPTPAPASSFSPTSVPAGSSSAPSFTPQGGTDLPATGGTPLSGNVNE